jgi:hypothetical protein
MMDGWERGREGWIGLGALSTVAPGVSSGRLPGTRPDRLKQAAKWEGKAPRSRAM